MCMCVEGETERHKERRRDLAQDTERLRDREVARVKH